MNAVVRNFIIHNINWKEIEKKGFCEFRSDTGAMFEIEDVGIGLKVEVTYHKGEDRHLLAIL